MSTLARLRGEPMSEVPLLGKRLTFYRQGLQRGALLGAGTLLGLHLPWQLIPTLPLLLPLSLAVAGFYLAAALMASLTPAEVAAEAAAKRWL